MKVLALAFYTILPSLLMFPERAMSSTANLDIVFTGLRVLEENICTRDPVVTANKSCADTVRFEGGGGGNEMWVIGEECCDGSSWRAELKDCQ